MPQNMEEVLAAAYEAVSGAMTGLVGGSTPLTNKDALELPAEYTAVEREWLLAASRFLEASDRYENQLKG